MTGFLSAANVIHCVGALKRSRGSCFVDGRLAVCGETRCKGTATRSSGQCHHDMTRFIVSHKVRASGAADLVD